LATTGFGVVIPAPDRKLECIAYGAIKTPAHMRLEDRLLVIRQDIMDLVSRHKPQVAAVERLFFNTNVTTAMAVAHARGVILLSLAEAGVEIFEYTPLQVKSKLTGYGMAEKSQMQSMVQRTLNLDKPPKPDDAADGLALCICYYFSRMRGKRQ